MLTILGIVAYMIVGLFLAMLSIAITDAPWPSMTTGTKIWHWSIAFVTLFFWPVVLIVLFVAFVVINAR